tara:strand:+ start:123 stop:545 length:423 start_codon:yes stop_codon:yes gene_type:complete
MARFKLKENEELLYERRHDWNTCIHRASQGTLYVTNKRVVFCATASWKQVLIELYGDRRSRNIRWEAKHNRIGFINGRYLVFFKAKWLTLDGKNTRVVAHAYFADGSDANKKIFLVDLISQLKINDSVKKMDVLNDFLND